jgi:PAS domain S-box-containing protein
MSKHTILVVDDTAHILKLSREIFEIAGYTVVTARDGEEALRVLAEKKIDLVVTDILMPNVDGYLLCYSIRTSEKWKDIPVIIYSATYTSFSDEKIAMELGADKFIRKPAPMQDLITAAQFLLLESRKSIHEIPDKPKSREATRLYSEGLVHKLETRNLELMQTAEKLEESESRLKEAQTIAHLGSWEIDMVNNLHYWSDGLFTILGANKEIAPSTEFFLSFVHKDDLEEVRKIDQQAHETLSDSSYDFRFIRNDGALRYGCSSYHFEFGVDRKPVRLSGIVQDVTGKKIIDQEREFDSSNLESLINNTNDLMWSVDRNLQVITFNRPFAKMVQQMSGQSVGKGSNILTTGFSEEQLNRFSILYNRAFSGEAFTEVEHNDGPGEFWSEISFYPIRNGTEIVGTACHSRDITQRKEMEAERLNYIKTIETKNGKLEEIAWIQSHGVRAPLARIMGLINLLQSPSSKTVDATEIMSYLKRSANDLDNVIREIVTKTEEIETRQYA